MVELQAIMHTAPKRDKTGIPIVKARRTKYPKVPQDTRTVPVSPSQVNAMVMWFFVY